MAKLEWDIDSVPNSPQIIVSILGGFNGIPQIKIGSGFYNPVNIAGSGGSIFPTVVDGANEVFYKDDIGEVKLCDYYYYSTPPCPNVARTDLHLTQSQGADPRQGVIPEIYFINTQSTVPQIQIDTAVGFFDADSFSPQRNSYSSVYFSGPGDPEFFFGDTNPIPEIRIKVGACEFPLATDVFTGQISEFPPVEIIIDVTNVSTLGGSNGEIDLIISGGSGNRTYVWGDGPTTEDRTGVTAGFYTVTINDQTVGFLETLTIEVTEEILSTIPCIDDEPVNPVNFIRFKGMQNVTLAYLQANGLPDCKEADNPAIQTGVFDETFDETFE